MEENNKTLSFLERMKQKAQSQQVYGGECKPVEAKMNVSSCPNCGAGRAKMDGLTKCVYCGFEFISVQLTDGLHITKEDNSK